LKGGNGEGSKGMGGEEAGGISILLAPLTFWYGDELVIEEVEVEGRGKGGRHWDNFIFYSHWFF
jgi:hypothetical protein